MTLLRPVSVGFVALTLAIFLGPVFTLGLSDVLRQRALPVLSILTGSLALFQMAILIVILTVLIRQPPPSSNRAWSFLVGGAGVLASANVARMALGLNWTGLGPELVQAIWFALPLALWAIALWPLLGRSAAPWWTRPMRLVVTAFPLIFLVAALGRIDFRLYTGVQTPTPILWILAYAPTLAAVALALSGWMAFEDRHRGSSRGFALDVAGVCLPALVIAAFVSTNTFIGFLLSATITWGSGYQLFTMPPLLAPLAVSSFLVTVAFAALSATVIRLRRNRTSTAGPLLAFTAVMSGIFPSAISILGSLVALELLWLNVTRMSEVT
ncbi:MAG: hypothetical protein V3U52_05325 [Thermoplasmata archaeon]